MDYQELWETTMDPDHRVLLQVTLDDAAAADEIFSILMGEDVESRRSLHPAQRPRRPLPRHLSRMPSAPVARSLARPPGRGGLRAPTADAGTPAPDCL